MSYILNALRKSERERQAVEPDTIADRIIVQHQPRHPSSANLIATLVMINVAILAYFLWFAERTPSTDPNTVVMVKPAESPHAEIALPASVANQTLPSQKTSNKLNAEAVTKIAPVPVNPSTDKKAPAEPMKPARLNKAVEVKKPVDVDIAVAKTVIPAKQTPVDSSIDNRPSIEPVIKEVLPSTADIQKEISGNNTLVDITPLPEKNALPFLDELPYEFQRELPELPINVFSYSSSPNERFVMIDMVKYIPGQRIKDSLDFKEIQADGIVVSYKGRTFKIRRP